LNHIFWLDTKQLNLNIKLKIDALNSSILMLKNQSYGLIQLKKEQQNLYNLLYSGYKISRGSFFVLMNAKNRLIQTQKSLLQTKKQFNNQIIELNYTQGAYND